MAFGLKSDPKRNLLHIFGGALSYLIPVEDHAIELTPEIAKKLLAQDDPNRAIITHNVEKISRAISAGSFSLNGEPVIIDDTGRLLNGQHRCEAVLRVGKSIPTIICVVPAAKSDHAFESMDSGRTRRSSDYVSIEGRQYPTQTSAAIGAILKYKKNYAYDNNHAPSSHEILEWIREHKDFCDCLQELLPPKLLGSAAIGIILWFSNNLRPQAIEFIKAVEVGADLKLNSPEWVLRERMLSVKQSKSSRHMRMSPYMAIALAIKAWNASVKGESIKILKLNSGEPYPIVIGG